MLKYTEYTIILQYVFRQYLNKCIKYYSKLTKMSSVGFEPTSA